MARVFSQKHSSTSVGNDGIYSVGEDIVEQIGQNSKIDCFAGISQEGLLTLHILVLFRAYASLRRMLTHKLPAKTLQSSICLESSHTLSLSLI